MLSHEVTIQLLRRDHRGVEVKLVQVKVLCVCVTDRQTDRECSRHRVVSIQTGPGSEMNSESSVGCVKGQKSNEIEVRV